MNNILNILKIAWDLCINFTLKYLSIIFFGNTKLFMIAYDRLMIFNILYHLYNTNVFL